MKVVVAMDSFKGSMTSMEAGNAVKEGILRAIPQAEVVVKPLADGGEGTTDALMEGLGGKRIVLSVTGPMGKRTECSYGILEDGKTAVMEMAQAAGMMLVAETERNPLYATTFGVGEMIGDAVHRGCRHFIMGIGGSATNDGGIGMLMALGFCFLDEKGQPVRGGADILSRITAVNASRVLPELKECEFRIACDVDNPLCGENGATFVYGPQKGLPLELCGKVDEDMGHYAGIAEAFSGKNCKKMAGAGAAGGLGFAFLTFLNARLMPGADLVLSAVGLEEEVKTAQYVVTGEGRLDAQTVMGKAPIRVAELAKQYGSRVIAFAGSVDRDAAKCNAAGIDAFFPIIRDIVSREKAMEAETAKQNLADTSEQVFRLIGDSNSQLINQYSGGSIKDRIEDIMKCKKPVLAVSVVSVLGIVILSAALLTIPQKAAKEKMTDGSAGSRKNVSAVSEIKVSEGEYRMKAPLGAEPLFVPGLTIGEGSSFTFSYDLASSYMPYGTYEIKEDILTASTSDGLYQYRFKIKEDDTLVFLEEGSSKVKLTDDNLGIAVLDGSEFVKQTKREVDVTSSFYPGDFDTEDSGENAFIYETEKVEEIAVTLAVVTEETRFGADGVELDYVDDENVIFHGYFGLFVSSKTDKTVIRSAALAPIGCDATQGDAYCEVQVKSDGTKVFLHPVNESFIYPI